MATGNNYLTTYYAKRIIGDDVSATASGALLETGSRTVTPGETISTWIFHDTNLGSTYGIKHESGTNKYLKIYGNDVVGWYINMDTGDVYILGKVGIGYDPETSGNTYKLYVNGTGYFSNDLIAARGLFAAYIELSSATPYIDFHFDSSSADFTSRIIESASGYLQIPGSFGVGGQNTSYKFYVNGTANITNTLYLSRTTDAEGTADNRPALIIGDVTGTHLEFDGNEIMAKASATTTSTLYLNNNGGLVQIGSGGLSVGGLITANHGIDVWTQNAGNNGYTGSGSAIQIREVAQVTTGQSAWTYAPKIGFHWGGRYQGTLGLHSNGQYYLSLSGGQGNATLNTGATWGGSVVTNSNWIGFYNAQGGSTRYGYIQANADRMYYRKENGVSSYHHDFNGHIYASSTIHAGGHVKALGGYLYSTANGYTLTMGSQNSSWCHMQSGVKFYFNPSVCVDGDVYPYTNNSRNCGTSGNKWAHMYCQGRVYLDEWIQFSGTTGLYAPNTNGAHFYPNNSTSYGAWQMNGSRNGYYGLVVGPGTQFIHLMDNGNDKGLYEQDQRWILYYQRSTQRLALMSSSVSSGYSVQVNGSLYVSSTFYAPSTCYTDSAIYCHAVWANRTGGEKQIGVDNGTAGNLYFYSNDGGKGIYSTSGYGTGALITINSSGKYFYGTTMNLTGYLQFGSTTWEIHVNSDTRLSFRYNGSWMCHMYTDGTVRARGSFTGSSRFIKHDIRPVMNSGNIIDMLKPVSFIYNIDNNNKTQYGLIYEDTISICPKICTPLSDNIEDRAISYGSLSVLLLKEIQDLRKRVKELETQIKNHNE